jgi:hypothetical protein
VKKALSIKFSDWICMKRLFFLLLLGLTISCTSSNQSSSLLKEDEFMITRKYLGVFIDYRQTGPETYSGPNLIWIKTSMESTYGKICAYGKKCEFSAGDRLYLTRKYYSPGSVSEYWVYTIENDSSVYYRVMDFQSDHKVFVKDWY